MAKQQYHLYQKPGETNYWARKRRKGQPDIYFNCETGHRPSAERRADEWIKTLIAQKFGEKPKRLFQDAAIRMAQEHFPTLKLKSAMRYKTALNTFIDAFDGLKIEEVTKSTLWTYEMHRRGVGIELSTIHYEFRVLSILFNLCDMWEWHDGSNIAQRYIKSRRTAGIKPAEPVTRYYAQEEEDALLKVAPATWRWRMIFAVETGIRLEEQLSLPWTSMDLTQKRLTISAAIAKNKKERKVPLTARAIEAAQGMRVTGSPWVCPKEDGDRFAWNTPHFWRRMQEFGIAAGIEDVDWHAWRKTCGCRLLQVRRFSMEAVQKWLGHSSIKETERAYAFLFVDQLQEMVDETQGRVTKITKVTPRVTQLSELSGKLLQING